MSSVLVKQNEESLSLDVNYKDFLQGVKNKLKKAQIRAALAANRELITFYWELGVEITEKQKAFSWGERFLDQFSHDMKQAFPEMRGFSTATLKRMRLFAQAYPDFKKGAQAVHQLPGASATIAIRFGTRHTQRPL